MKVKSRIADEILMAKENTYSKSLINSTLCIKSSKIIIIM